MTLAAQPHIATPIDEPPSAAPPPRRPHRGLRIAAWILSGVLILIALLVLALALMDWNALRGPIGRFASARMHREVVLDHLSVHPWSLEPSAEIGGLRIANPAWAGAGHTADIGQLLVQIKLLPLLRGELVLLRLEATKPDIYLRRDAQGRETWDFSGGARKDKPLKMPPVRRFVIRDGHLALLDDERKLKVDATLEASERLGVANRGFQLRGDGSLNNQPFRLEAVGGPLLNVDPNKPYAFDADIQSGATRVTVRGVVPKPFDLGELSLAVTARGPDLEELYDLTGVPFPNTPPYSLKGRLVREGKVYKLSGLSGRVGDSDLAGTLSVDASRKRPFLTADLRTERLDFGDLMAVFGGAPKIRPGKTVSPAQQATAATLQAEHRLLPDATLKVDRIRALDADVRYRAAGITHAPVDLRSGSLRVKLDNGLLTADPLSFDLPQGRIAGRIALDARGATPVTDADLRLSNARLEQFIPIKSGGAPALTGGLVGRIKLHGAGESVHRAAANADGRVVMIVPGGEIREAFAELIGVDVTKGLGLLLAKNQDRTPIRCAVASFTARDGVLTADRLVFDTGPVLGEGRGTVDLRNERLDLSFQGHPKQFRLVRLLAPIEITGPIVTPKLGVDKGKAVAQGGFAAVLATVASPLAAVLPFVDAGLAKDAQCGALIAEASAQGAPVRSVKKAPASRKTGG